MAVRELGNNTGNPLARAATTGGGGSVLISQTTTSTYEDITTAGAGTYTIPATAVYARVIAVGGGGGSNSGSIYPGGAGGGCAATKVFATEGKEIEVSYTVGAAGALNTDGGDTTVSVLGYSLTAEGGQAGQSPNSTAAQGGGASGGDFNFTGGNGGTGNLSGGGGAAGPDGNGADGRNGGYSGNSGISGVNGTNSGGGGGSASGTGGTPGTGPGGVGSTAVAQSGGTYYEYPGGMAPDPTEFPSQYNSVYNYGDNVGAWSTRGTYAFGMGGAYIGTKSGGVGGVRIQWWEEQES